MDEKRAWLGAPRRTLIRNRVSAAFAALVVGVLFLLLWAQMGKWREERDLQLLRNRVTQDLTAHRNALASALANRLALLEGLRAFVEVTLDRGERLEEQYPAFASRLYGVVRGTRNLGVAEGTTYRLVYPERGNEAIIGYDLLADERPEMVQDTRRAMASRSLVISGPTELRQGGTGLIARGAIRHGGRFWGLVGTAFDLAPILQEARLVPEDPTTEVAVRRPGGAPFVGASAVFAPDAIIERLELPDGAWEMGARPVGGWLAPGAESRRLWLLSGVVLALVPMTMVFVFAWRQHLLAESAADAERRVAEGTAALARTNQLLENILYASPLPIVMIDPQGIVQVWNPAAERVFGWTAAETIGRFNPLVGPDIHQEFWDIQQRIRAGETLAAIEVERRRKDGRAIQLRLFTAGVVEPDGRVVGAMGLIQDVTEQRQLEAQYRHAQKMEAIGQLAGGVAHDFNNLLQVITGYTALALGNLASEESPYPELTEIGRAAERASALVSQLLTFSRRQKIERRPLDLNQTIGDLLKMLRRLIGEHIELDFVPGDGVKPVLADAGLLEQALMNLCVNARDVMPDGGRISITTANAAPGRDLVERRGRGGEGEFVALSVADTGPGIPPELKDRIFEPFFTTKEIGKGTGLGLATVYGIVEQHDGMIEIAADAGPGATFRIYLPVATRVDERPPHAPPAAVRAPGGTGTILLAEDEDLVRSLAKRVLEGAGYQVLAASDGEEAMALVQARAGEIDLALLDVVMPKASGRDVSLRLKAIRPEVPVIFCSGYSRQMLDESGMPDEGVELILKPYAPRALLERVSARLRRVETP